MRYSLLAILASAVVAGCATSPVPIHEARQVPPERIETSMARADGPAAKITAVRDSGMLGSGCYFGLYVDGTLVARLATGERHTVELATGEHILGTAVVGRALCSGEGERREISTILKPGENKVYRISARANGEVTIEPTTMLQAK